MYKTMHLDDINESDETLFQELELMKKMGLPTSFCGMSSEKEVCTLHGLLVSILIGFVA